MKVGTMAGLFGNLFGQPNQMLNSVQPNQYLTAQQINLFRTPAQFRSLTPSQMLLVTPEKLRSLPPPLLFYLKPEQKKALTQLQINELNPDQIKAIAKDLMPNQLTWINQRQIPPEILNNVLEADRTELLRIITASMQACSQLGQGSQPEWCGLLGPIQKRLEVPTRPRLASSDDYQRGPLGYPGQAYGGSKKYTYKSKKSKKSRKKKTRRN